MRTAIYARQSLDRTGEGLAVNRQLAECRTLIEANGWDVADIYTDNDVSASSGRRRPEWSRLLADLRGGRHDVLVCWHTDRLYRRLRDLVELVEIAESRSLRIAAVKSADIDLSTPAGRMLAGMLGHAARYEVEQKSARQVAANRARAQRGVMIWTRRPFGFDRHGNDVYIVESEAGELRKAANRVLAGEALAAVCRDLDARGVTSTTGARWYVSTLRRCLLNPRNAGRLSYNSEDMGASGPAIFDVDTFDRVRGVLTDPRRRTASSTVAKHFLSGLLICGRCGAVMFATPVVLHGKRWMSYKCFQCRLARKLEPIDQLVEATVVRRLARPDAVQLLSPDVDVARLRGKSGELRERRDGLAALLADGLLAADAVRAQAGRLTEQISDLERQIDAATGASPLTPIVGAEDVAARWAELSLMSRRGIVKTLLVATVLPVGKGVRFDPDHVDIRWTP